MNEGWRQKLQVLGAVPPEAESLSGDIDLLVPLEAHWRVLDLSGGYGARASVAAHWCREVVSVVTDPAHVPVLEARVSEAPPGRFVLHRPGDQPPLEPASFQLIVVEGESPWTVEEVRALLQPGGWLIWLVEGASMPGHSRRLSDLPGAIRSGLEWGVGRVLAPRRWQKRLETAGYRMARIYTHPREYVWGYLPIDAYRVQRYYLESLQEEAQGPGRGRAKVARWTGRLGIYPFLVSAYVVVARAVEGVRA